jgi:hypothetical protein
VSEFFLHCKTTLLSRSVGQQPHKDRSQLIRTGTFRWLQSKGFSVRSDATPFANEQCLTTTSYKSDWDGAHVLASSTDVSFRIHNMEMCSRSHICNPDYFEVTRFSRKPASVKMTARKTGEVIMCQGRSSFIPPQYSFHSVAPVFACL